MKTHCIEPLEARIAPAVLTLAGPVSGTEGDVGQSDITFKVLLDIPSPTALTVKVNTSDGSATVADSDYSALTDFIVTIPANTLEKTFVVKVNGDTKYEQSETFSVSLSAPSGSHTLGAASTAVGTITNGADPLPKLSIAAASKQEGNVGTTQMKFVVSLTNASSEAISFNWSTQDLPFGSGSAVAGTDYTAVSGLVGTINPGATSVELVVNILPDTVKEQNELFEVQLTNPVMGATPLEFSSVTASKATGTIVNDEPDLSLDLTTTPRPVEGTGDGSTIVNFVVKLNVAATQTIEVFVSTVDGTATTASGDYTAVVAQKFEIAPGQTQITVPVTVGRDSVFEGNETFSLKLDSANFKDGPAISIPTSVLGVEIVDDETVPTLSVKGAATLEPASGSKVMNFTVTLSGPADEDVTFSWNTEDIAGQATENADYTKVAPTTVTILAGNTTATLPVTIFSDSDTVKEQFRVLISNPTVATIAVGGGQAQGSILNDALTISVVAPADVVEGTIGNDGDALFRISRGDTDSLDEAVTVRVSTVDGSATSGLTNADFTALNGVVFTIPAGLKDYVVPVKVKPDNRKESNETFSLRIDSLEIAGAAFDGVGTASASATIVDDDANPTVSVGAASVTEGNSGIKMLAFVVTLSNAADTDITFDYVTVLDTAGIRPASAADFTEVLTAVSVTIPAGQTSKTVELDITGDVIREGAETFFVKISNAKIGATALTIPVNRDVALMTITDDEPVVSITAPAARAEGSTAGGKTDFTFTISLDTAAPENIAVRLSAFVAAADTATVGVDFEVTDKWIIIAAGSRTGTFVVKGLHDTLAETSEAFSVRVDDVKVGVNATLDVNGNPQGGVTLPQDVIAPAVATITDDDVVALSIGDVTILEGNSGTKQMTFTVSMPNAASRDVMFDYRTANGSAESGLDYTAIAGLSATIPAGSTSVTVTVDIFGDTVSEGDETLTVVISNAKVGVDAATISDAFGVGTILNDEQTVSINSSLSVAENIGGGIALMTVTLSSVSTVPVTVNLSLTNGTATKGTDFSDPAALTVTILAGQTTATVSVPITNDAFFETNETFDVYLIGATNAQLGAGTRGTVTIENDDVASKLTINTTPVSEGTGASESFPEFTDMIFTLTLDKAAGAPVTFNWETLSGAPYTATSGDDFTAVPSNVFTIAANVTTASFVVKVKKDAVFESSETVGVLVSNVSGALLQLPDTVGGTSKTLTGTISNDEPVPVISISDERVLEGESGTSLATFTVTLSRKADKDVTFRWQTAPGTADASGADMDYMAVGLGALVTIPAGATTVTLPGVTIFGDTTLELDETFLVQIVDPRLDGVLMTGGRTEAVGTIRRDEITAFVGSATVSVTEGDDDPATPALELVDVLIPVTLKDAGGLPIAVPVGQTLTVGYELVSGAGFAAATSGTDYEVPSSLVVVFAEGETTKNILIKVRPDLLSELSETFSVRLKDSTSSNVKVSTGIDATTVVTILDNDPVPTISIANVGVFESAGSIRFTVTLDRAASSPVTFKIQTEDGTAISTGALFDFTGRPVETLSIAAGQVAVTYDVVVRADQDTTEGIENFVVRLSEPTVGQFAGSAATIQATGTISDADVSSIKIASVSRAEGNSPAMPAKMIFTVTRTGSSAKAVTADYAISFNDVVLAAGVTAAQAADIASALMGTVTIPAGQNSATIEVLLTGDAVAEGNEAFKITLSNITNAFTVADGDKAATGTITEDDVTVRFRNSIDPARTTVISQVEGANPAFDPAVEAPLAIGATTVPRMLFYVDLNTAATTEVVVTFSVGAGTAEAGSDFTIPTLLTVKIPAGSTRGALVIPITQDSLAEQAETLTVNIVSATGSSVDANHNTRTGEIRNDDAAFRVLDGARVEEGNTGTRNLIFRVELADAVFAPGSEYSVDFTTVNGLAIAGQDYTTTADTLTFTANGILMVSVPITGDTIAENDETLELVISNSKQNTQSIAAILDERATGTIQDDEFSVSIGNATITEGDAGQQLMVFVVSLPVAPTNFPIVIKYITVDGTAKGAAPGATDTAGTDFRAVTDGTLTIPANQRTAQISIPIFGDLVQELGGETFKVMFTQVSGARAVTNEATGTINDTPDSEPTLSIGDISITEGDTGSQTMKFRVSLSQIANADVTFVWDTILGTAGAADFTQFLNEPATIPVGSKFIDIEVPVTGDVTVEGNENFTVKIKNALRGAGAIVISDDTAIGSINDDDGVLRVKTGEGAVTFAEEDGAPTPAGTKARVNLEIVGLDLNFAFAEPITVSYTLSAPTGEGDVTAKAGTPPVSGTRPIFDYVGTSGTLTKTFPAGTKASELFLEVQLEADSIDEWNEKFVVTVIGVTAAKVDTVADNLKSVVTITDNDAAPTLQLTDVVVQESAGNAQFVVRLSGNVTERDIVIAWDALSDTAVVDVDFTAPTNKALTITAGQREGTMSVAIVNDNFDEKEEKFRVSVLDAKFSLNGTLSEDVGYVGGKRNSIGTIPQNDLRTVTVTGGSAIVSASAVTSRVAAVVEGGVGDTSAVTFTIRLDAAPSSTPVKVLYTTVAGTAFAGSDFVATTGEVIFLPGELTKTVTIPVTSDDVAELDEQFKLRISIPAVDGFAVLSGNNEAVGTIEADESVFSLVRVTPDGPIPEGAKVKFKVVRSGAADFAATVSYASLEDSTAATLRATAGSDFVAKTGSISFAAGETDSGDFGQFIEIDVLNDSAAENQNEKFLVRLTNATNGVVSTPATVGGVNEGEATVLISDDDPNPFIRIEHATSREGVSLGFVVKLVNASGASIAAPFPMRVSYQTLLNAAGAENADSNDFPSGFSVTQVSFVEFATGDRQKTISIGTLQDSVAEQDEVMTVHLTKAEKDINGFVEIMTPFLPLAGTTPAATVDATGTIRNDDTVVTVAAVSQAEGNATLNDMTFVATIPVAVPYPITFHFKTKNATGDTAADSGDYESVADMIVTIPANQTQVPFVVKIKGDTIRETDQAFLVELSGLQDAVFAGNAPALNEPEAATVNATITNDDTGPLLSITAGQVVEGNSGETDLIFTVTLTNGITENVTVNFATSDGTAKADGFIKDYLEQHGLITFTPSTDPSVTTQTREIVVKIKGDLWKEGDETVTVNLFNPTGTAEFVSDNSGAETISATGTILDGDDSTVGVIVRDVSVVEGGVAVFTVELTALAEGTVTFTANTRTGSADSSDFTTLTNQSVSFNGATSLSRTITVSTRGDNAFEASENFHLDLSAPTEGLQFVPGASSAQAIIYNDDMRIISAREFEFIDEDGDLVNIKVSKGALFARNQFGVLASRGIVSVADAGTVGGKLITSINTLGTGREFEGANISVTRKAQAGFDRVTDGRVNVGEIISAVVGFGSLQQGVNLGSVKVDGDLGRIVAGSTLKPSSIAKLDVGSFGVNEGANGTQSILFGRAGSILVRGDMEGSAFFVGTTVSLSTGFTTGLGTVGSFTIGGKLIGGSGEQSGYISSNAKIGKISVGGIVGGEGNDSGAIQATSSIGAFTALGDVQGGEGFGSGNVIGSSIGKVTFGAAAKKGTSAVRASLIGGDAGPDPDLGSNQILAQVGSGAIVSFSGIKSISMIGDIRGGVGNNSGMIFANANVGKVTVGDIVGGGGESSGRIRVIGSLTSLTAGTIQGSNSNLAGSVQVDGKLGQAKIANLFGSTENTTAAGAISRAGSIAAGDIGKIFVSGSIKAATAEEGTHLASASITSARSIATLTVNGSVEGSLDGLRPAIISAAQNIGKVSIHTLRFAEILAGYTTGETVRGTLTNADAQIGAVVINDYFGSSIVAGASAGSDQKFGTQDDVSPVNGLANSSRLISKIASLTIKNIDGTGLTNESGIVAQDVGIVKVGGVRVVFGSDELKEISPGAFVFINEV